MIKRFKVFLAALFLTSLPIIAMAEIIPSGCSEGSASTSVCGLNELIQVFVNIYNAGVQYVGAVSVLFFIIGGFMLLISGGRSNLVDLGKKIIIGSLVGLFLVLTSFIIVQMVQTQILNTSGQYIISSDAQCSGKKDGTPCNNNGAINYVCQSGVCSNTTRCVFENKDNPREYIINGQKFNLTKTCLDKSFCDTDTIQTNLCPGDASTVCCFIDPSFYNR